uniref:PAG3 protein n=1 Tax=Trypanosoma brucei TaxID=5691 RepID=Q26787_9TRYP|nr:short ORF2 [Trypanosoma brucei brucei]
MFSQCFLSHILRGGIAVKVPCGTRVRAVFDVPEVFGVRGQMLLFSFRAA